MPDQKAKTISLTTYDGEELQLPKNTQCYPAAWVHDRPLPTEIWEPYTFVSTLKRETENGSQTVYADCGRTARGCKLWTRCTLLSDGG